MIIMACRHKELQKALQGYVKTGIALIADNNGVLDPAGFSDDIGIYYFIPKLANIGSLSLDQAIDVFFYGIIVITFLSGLVGLMFLYREWLNRIIAAMGICLFAWIAFVSGRIYEVYVVAPSLVIGIFPWILLFTKKNKNKATIVGFLFMLGIIIGYAHVVRSHSGTPVLLFLIICILGKRYSTQKFKVLLLTVLMLGLMLPKLHFHFLVHSRNTYLKQNRQTYESIIPKHPFWHTVYIGFGFLDNQYGIKYQDEVATQKVKELSPSAGYLSKEYEDTLRDEVFQLIETNPHFVLRTVAAKMRTIFFYFFIFSNVGLLCAVLYPKKWYVELAFWCALAFSALFGIIAIPSLPYTSGLLAIAAVYGVISVNHAIGSGMLIWIGLPMRKKERG